LLELRHLLRMTRYNPPWIVLNNFSVRLS
jgi:hypothetical protein